MVIDTILSNYLIEYNTTTTYHVLHFKTIYTSTQLSKTFAYYNIITVSINQI